MDLLALVIVFDTNILLKHHLQDLWKLREMAERTVVKMTFLIPQIVLTELQHFSDPELEVVARKARKYIQVLENKGTGLVIETPQDAEQANSLFESKLNDDEILKCCLLMKKRGKDVVLFSDDHMLLIKAQINSLKTISTEDFAVKIFDFALPNSDIMTPAKLFSMIEKDLPEDNSHLKKCKQLLLKAQDSNMGLDQAYVFLERMQRFLEESKREYLLPLVFRDAISLIGSYSQEFKMQNESNVGKTNASILSLFRTVLATINKICDEYENLSVPVTKSDIREKILAIVHEIKGLQQQVEIFLKQPCEGLYGVEFSIFLINFLSRLGVDYRLSRLSDFVKGISSLPKELGKGLEQIKQYESRLNKLSS